MKKMMVLLGAVAFAASMQAATIDWQFSELSLAENNPADVSTASGGYTAYLFTDAAYQTMIDSVVAGVLDKAKFTGFIDQAEIVKTVMGEGMAFNFDTSLQYATGESGNYRVVLANDSGFVGSDAIAATSYTDPLLSHVPANWTISVADTPITGNSYSFASVPEPTSGLLLLLGVAGLALRRRRA